MSPSIQGFNPAETGPIDVVKIAADRVISFLTDPKTGTISGVLLVAAAGLMLHYNVQVPNMPTWMYVALLATLFVSPGSIFVGKILSVWLYADDSIPLIELNPKQGDVRLLKVSPDRFEQMRVVTENGKLRDRDFLHQITVNGQHGYELTKYHENPNVAVASWQAGASNASIRRQKAQIDNIQTDLEKEADKALELLANFPTLLRGITKEVSEHMVRVVEGVEMPEGGGLHEKLTEQLESADPSEDLLGGADASATDQGDADDESAGDVSMSDIEEGMQKLQALADGGED